MRTCCYQIFYNNHYLKSALHWHCQCRAGYYKTVVHEPYLPELDWEEILSLDDTADVTPQTVDLGGTEVSYVYKYTYYDYTRADKLTAVREAYKVAGETDETGAVLESGMVTVGEKTTRYVYDDAGNQISTAAEYLIPTDETADEEYGLSSGNYDSVVEVSINEYNGLNQLVNTTNIKDGNRTFASYVYNGDGLRVQKTVDGAVTDYIYSGSYIIKENDTRYIRGLSYHYVHRADGTFYYFCNAHGDVTNVVNSSKETVATYDYDEFGNLTSETGDFDNDIRYAGEFYDSESENYYLRSRYYDPTVGRFTQQDTFLGVDSNPLSLNRYTYCHNNPIAYVDPSGHEIRTYSAGGPIYEYDDSQITSSEQDYQSSVWTGRYERDEINDEQLMLGMSSIGITIKVVGGRYTPQGGGQSSNFIPAEDVVVMFNEPLSFENSVTAASLFGAYNEGWLDEDGLLNQLDALSAAGIKTGEISGAIYPSPAPYMASYIMVNGQRFETHIGEDGKMYMNGSLYDLALAIDREAELTWDVHIFRNNTPSQIKMHSFISNKKENIDFIKDKRADVLEGISIREFLENIGLADSLIFYGDVAIPYAEINTRSQDHNDIINVAKQYQCNEYNWTTYDIAWWKTFGGDEYINSFKLGWIQNYKSAIIAAAKKYNIPEILLAGVAYVEVGGDPMWIDGLAYSIRSIDENGNANRTSFGYLSMQVGVGLETLGYAISPYNYWQNEETIRSLVDPEESIFMAAKHLRTLVDVDYRGVDAADMTDEQIKISASRYNLGASIEKNAIFPEYGQIIIDNKDSIMEALE